MKIEKIKKGDQLLAVYKGEWYRAKIVKLPHIVHHIAFPKGYKCEKLATIKWSDGYTTTIDLKKDHRETDMPIEGNLAKKRSKMAEPLWYPLDDHEMYDAAVALLALSNSSHKS